MSKLSQLASIEGFDSIDDLLAEAVYDTCYAICTNPECDFTTILEPDAENVTCEECGTPTVTSCLILAGLC